MTDTLDRRTCPRCSHAWDAQSYTSVMTCPECRAFERRLPAFTVVELLMRDPTLTVGEATAELAALDAEPVLPPTEEDRDDV